MTIDTDAIRQRADEATHGPWRVGEKTPTGADLWERPIIRDVEDEDGTHESQVCAVEYQTGGFHFPHGEALADADFIAAARTHVPALCDEVELLRTRVADRNESVSRLVAERNAHANENARLRSKLADILAMAERFDTPRDSSRVRVFLGDLKHLADRAITEPMPGFRCDNGSCPCQEAAR